MQPAGGGGLQLGGGGLRLNAGLLGQQQQQQQQQQQALQLGQLQQQQRQLGVGGGGGLPGLGATQQLGGGLAGLGATQQLGTMAPVGGSLGFNVKLPMSTMTAGTASTGLTGLTSGAGLQLGGLQTGLPLPKPAASAANTSTGLTGLQLGQAAAGLKLPQPGQTGLTGLPQAQVQAASIAAPSLTVKPQTGLTGLTGLKPPPPYTAPTSGLSLNPTLTATTTVSGLTGLTSKLTTTTTAAPGVGLGLGLPKPTAASTIKPGLTGLTTAATTVSTGLTSSAAGGAAGGYGKKYTYKELENLVNKWSLELQDQEKVFLQQSNQVNAWDRMLADSGDKVAELNEEVQRVKTEQQRVDSELDLIQSQQQELEDLLSTLEKELDQTPTIGVGVHYADMQRTKTFKMAENVDSELKRMAQDLKEIIDQMNSANSNQDEESTFQQIVKILNAHTDSLGWIDRETALLRQKVDDVAKVTEYRKREQERSFRLAFTQ